MVDYAFENNVVRVYLPTAEEVFLVAEFNQWSTTATPMRFLGDGVFEVHLHAGETLGRFGFYVIEPGRSVGKIVQHEPDFEPMVG